MRHQIRMPTHLLAHGAALAVRVNCLVVVRLSASQIIQFLIRAGQQTAVLDSSGFEPEAEILAGIWSWLAVDAEDQIRHCFV